MGREIKRVPQDFDLPIGEIWPGFLMPDSLHGQKCIDCDGDGGSPYSRLMHKRWYGYVPFSPAETGSTPLTPETPAVREFAERNVSRSPSYYGTGEYAIRTEALRLATLWNGMWMHHMAQVDVDALIEGGRLRDFTHTWIKGDGWQPITPPPVVTAEQVNLWSLNGLSHDSINCWIVVRAACERAGEPTSCALCEGHGSIEKYEGQRAEAEAWEPTGPPSGDGWQLWETVSEGSPISPVFATADDLATWMSDPSQTRGWVPFNVAQKFIAEGWAPTLVSTPELGVASGVEFIGMHEEAAA